MVGNTVLLIGGESRSTRVLARLLADDGYQVELAADGASALARLDRDLSPAVLLTESQIPLVDGSSVAQHARQGDAALPIIFLTEYPQLLPAGTMSGALVHTKPVDYALLRRQLNGLLAAASARRDVAKAQPLQTTNAGRAC